MNKLFFIVVCLLLNSSVAEAKFDEDLQKRCVNIVNYKLAGELDSLLQYYYPKTRSNPKFVDFHKKRQVKHARRIAEKGAVDSVSVVDTNELPNPASDSKHAGFNIVEQRSILTHVKFSKEDRPVSYECIFGLEKESNEWFMLNAI
ncbi:MULTISPECIES: hypothetical protein [Shewanella]|uniref:DUF4019 domain-containing protein n=2 Tax=Shewanella TaxID=22 RepID=A0A3G8LQP5_9GAMM|nr:MULTISPECIES: hypothetical protein [Shewanella]AZG72103.1 hypothetical protein EGC82_04580 [Shewanella livingstonensis]GGQ24109.1 hypothetical protein GCM10009411_25100 [Shewanella litoralis]